NFLVDVGLDYLTISRSANTLAGGEAQRIRLASQIGSGLTGVLYVLDEPSIGLHPKDNEKLIKTLKKLRDLDNTVLVVEHDQETMEASDMILDFGPEAGIKGGNIVAQGTIEEIKNNPNSPTGLYLSGKKKIQVYPSVLTAGMDPAAGAGFQPATKRSRKAILPNSTSHVEPNISLERFERGYKPRPAGTQDNGL